MKLDAPKRILLEMVLMEQDIAFEDDMLIVKLGNEEYYLDSDSGRWISFAGIAAASGISQQLDELAATDGQAQLAVNAARVGQPTGGRRRGGIQKVKEGGEEFDAPWYVDYRAKLDEWGERGMLTALPGPIASRFPGYWMQVDTGKDFVVVVPTNYIMQGSRNSSGGFKGLYIFRKNAHDGSRLIETGEDWTSYLPKLDPERRGLLDVRKNAIALGLGRFLRRDHHTDNITKNLEQFESFDELVEYTDLSVESIMTRAQYRVINPE